MICLAVHRNESLLCVAGIDAACLLTSVVAGGGSDDDPASFHIAGMQDLPNERSAHVYWLHETGLSSGDRLRYTMVESNQPSSPIEVKPADSPEYLREQRAFEELERNHVPPQSSAPLRWPALEFRLKLKAEKQVCAKLPAGQESIMCSIQWDKWRPGRCRVYVRSFSGFAEGTEYVTTDWLRGDLHVGDSFELAVYA